MSEYIERPPQRYTAPLDIIGDDDLSTPPEEPLTYDNQFPHRYVAYGAQVDRTLRHGDYFDQRESLRWRHVLKYSALPVPIAAEVAAATGGFSPLATATIALSTWFFVRKAKKRDTDVLLDQEQGARNGFYNTGQRFELYTPPKDKTAEQPEGLQDTEDDRQPDVIWYGPGETASYYDTLAGHLGHMAELAQDSPRMHVLEEVCNALPESIRRRVYEHAGTTSESMQQYVRYNKKVLMQAPKKLVSADTAVWRDAAQEYTQETYLVEKPQEKIEIIADKLRQANSGNPLLPMAEIFAGQGSIDADIKERFQRKARRTLSARLQRQELYPERIRELIEAGGRPPRNTDAYEGEDGRLSADGRHILWNTRLGKQKQDTLRYHGLTEEQFIALVNNPELDPAKAERVLEIALLRVMHDQELPIIEPRKLVDNPHIYRTSHLQAGASTQQLLAHDDYRKVNIYPHRAAQFSAAVLATLGLYTGLSIAHDVMDAQERNAITAARIDVANKRQVMPEYVTTQDAKEYVGEHNNFLSGWDGYRGVTHKLDTTWKELVDLLPDPGGEPASEEETAAPAATTSSGDSRVGDVGWGNEPDTDEFHITSHGGASTEGFWPASTSSTLSVERMPKHGLAMSWKSSSTSSDPQWLKGNTVLANIPAKLPDHYKNSPTIEVDRTLGLDDIIDLDTPEGTERIVNIPVLEDTRPVAASDDGHKLTLIRKADNTYAVSDKDRFGSQAISGKLKYWLVPDVTAPKPKAVQRLELLGTDEALGKKTLKEYQKYNGKGDTLATLAPQTKADLKEQAQALSSDISNNWAYAYKPFGESQNEWKSIDDFVSDASDGKRANCNVANTIVGLSDPTAAQVFGYKNKPGSSSVALSAHEAHQKRTDGDATPMVSAIPKPRPAANAAEAHGATEGIPFKEIGMAVAGIALLSQKRRLRRKLERAADKRDQHAADARAQQLSSYSPAAIAGARATAEMIIYAPPRPLLEAHESLVQGRQRLAQSEPDITPNSITERPYLYSDDTLEKIQEQYQVAANVDMGIASGLQESALILNLARRVAQDSSAQTGQSRVRLNRMLQPIDRTSAAAKAIAYRLRGVTRAKA